MKKILLNKNGLRAVGAVLFVCFMAVTSFGQTTVFSDAFGASASTVTGSGNTLTGTTAYTTGSAAGTPAGISYALTGSQLSITGTSTNKGSSTLVGALSAFSAPFNSTLSSNSNIVTWTFNMKNSRTSSISALTSAFNPTGSSYSTAVILATNATTNTALTATSGNTTKGYAVVLSSGTTTVGTTNKIDLVSFTNGLTTGSTVTSIRGTTTDYPNNSFFSIKVTYDPTNNNNNWSLFVETNAGSFADPVSTSTQIGSTISNTTHTGVAMSNFMFFHTNTGASVGSWDNFKVVVGEVINAPSTTTLTGFNYASGGPSAEQFFTISALGLTGNLVLTPPTDYEISLTSGSGFVNSSSNLSIAPSSGTVATTPIYVRLKAGLSSNSYNSEPINITSTNATTRTVTCSGTVSTSPAVTLNTASFTSAFPNTAVGSSSISSNFTVAGANLGSDNIIITPPTNFEVSTDNMTFSTSAITLTSSSGTVAVTTIYARYTPTGSGSFSDNIAITTTTNVVALQNVAVSGYLSKFYYKGTGALSSTSSWSGKSDLTGTDVPTNFTTAGVSYVLLTSKTTEAAWTVSGTGSKVVVGDPSVASVILTIASNFGITGTIDLPAASSGSNSLIIREATTQPTLGTLHSSSEVHYEVSNSSLNLTATFGKLIIGNNSSIGTGTSGVSSTATIQTSLTVEAGSTLLFSSSTNPYLYFNSNTTATISGILKTTKLGGFVSFSNASANTSSTTGSALQFKDAETAGVLNLAVNSTIWCNRGNNVTAQVIPARTDYSNLTIEDNSATGANNKISTGAISVAGILTVSLTQGSTFTLGGDMTIQGSLVFTAGSLTLSGFNLTMASGSMLKGTGTIIGDFTNPTGSTIAPGASPGTTTINGAFTNVGDWAIELGGPAAGTEYDHVLASGAATLTSGIVNVALINSYDPALGASFVILDAVSLTGTFTTINLPALSTGKTWATPIYNNATGTVTLMVNVVLTVELTQFTAKANNNTNLLKWTTATEKNNMQFNIERSTNGSNFTSIGTVKGSGTRTTANNYTFTDETPLSISYYRLQSVDFDGKAQASNIVSVFRSTNGKLKVYPTVASDKLNIVADNNEAQTFGIYDLMGKTIQTGQLNGQKELSISTLTTGTYVLKVGSEVVKFVKN